jgi:hypothetical protein
MSQRGTPRKNANLFRITQAVFAVLFGGIAIWLLTASQYPVVAWIFAVAAAFALVDAIVGWRPGSKT